MGPFGVIDVHADTHTPGPTCAGCLVPGFPRPCPRVTDRRLRKHFSPEGRETHQTWDEVTCPGHQHAEATPGNVLETRCDVCGVHR